MAVRASRKARRRYKRHDRRRCKQTRWRREGKNSYKITGHGSKGVVGRVLRFGGKTRNVWGNVSKKRGPSFTLGEILPESVLSELLDPAQSLVKTPSGEE